MTSKIPEMEEGHLHHAGNAKRLLEEKLMNLTKAGGAIVAVNNCLQAVETMDTPEVDDDFKYLTLVEGTSLNDALELLGKYIQNESKDLCKSFGIPRYV